MNSLVLSLLMAAPAAGGDGGGLMAFLPFVLIVVIFYFMIIRPQNKKQKETRQMLSALRKGDRVVTVGGIHGIIQSVREKTVIVKVDDSTKIEFNRAAISSVDPSNREEKEEEKAEEKEKTEEKK